MIPILLHPFLWEDENDLKEKVVLPRDAKADDQTRVMTPADAARAGANFLVIGRPIFSAPDPVAAAQAILAEVGSAEPSTLRS